MIKKIFLALILISLVATEVSAADYYSVGVDAFKKGSFDNAASNLEHAIRINSKNINARYYLAQTYLRQNRVCDATNQYNRIILLAPDSDAAILSEEGLSLIQQSYSKGGSVASNDALARYKDNYIDYVLANDGQPMKWKSFPISVYIEPTSQRNLALQAFKQWQAKSNNLVSFQFVSAPENAQITVNFKDALESSSTDAGYINGISKPYCVNGYLSKSDISILSINPATKQLRDDNSVLLSTLHEIGHSLGFQGHSPNENDVMFESAKSSQVGLTQRDINTLNMLYRMDKNSLIARNNGQGNGNIKLQQALSYAKEFPDKSLSWSNLGDIYRSKKMYPEAINNYKRAISIEPDKAGLYNLLGSAYSEMGDKQGAFTNLKTACDLDKSNLFYLYQFAQMCFVSGQKETGSLYVKSFIKANPQSMTDEKMRALLTLYK